MSDAKTAGAVVINQHPGPSLTEQQMQTTLDVARAGMKQELRKGQAEATKLGVELGEEAKCKLKVLGAAVEKETWAHLRNGHFGTQELIDAWNTVLCSGPDGAAVYAYEKMEEMVIGVGMKLRYYDLIDPGELTDDAGCIRVKIQLDLRTSIDQEDRDVRENAERHIGIGMSPKLSELFDSYRKAWEASDAQLARVRELENKLTDLDAVVSQMKNKLLSDQLRSTEEGAKFLDDVLGMVGDFLTSGKQVDMLEAAKPPTT